jgi:hypothetical protein
LEPITVCRHPPEHSLQVLACGSASHAAVFASMPNHKNMKALKPKESTTTRETGGLSIPQNGEYTKETARLTKFRFGTACQARGLLNNQIAEVL